MDDIMPTIRINARAATPFILITAVLDVLAMGIVLPVLPALIEKFVGSSSAAGFVNGSIVALWALMQFVSSPVMGSLSDRFGRRPIILLSTGGLASAYVILALAPSLAWLVLGRLIAGVTSASLTAVSAYLADVTAPEQRPRAYGLVGAAFSAGLVAGPLLGGMLGELSPRAPFWIAGALSALAFLYGAFVLPESLPAKRRRTFSWKRAHPFGAMQLLRSHYELSTLAFLNFLMFFAYYVFSAVFVLYAIHRYNWSAWEVGAVFALIGVLDMLVQGVLVAPVTKRFGQHATMILGFVAGAIGMLSLGLAPSGLWFVLAIIPTAFRMLAAPMLPSLMTRRVSESEQGQLQGANMSLVSIAGIISPVFFGWIYSVSVSGHWGAYEFPGAAFVVAAAVLLTAAVIAYRVARRVEHEQLPPARCMSR
jgi:MFS transporter, DHA1 family, tetracycline resistance protein